MRTAGEWSFLQIVFMRCAVDLRRRHCRRMGHEVFVHADDRDAPEFQALHRMHGPHSQSVAGGVGRHRGHPRLLQSLFDLPSQLVDAGCDRDGVRLDAVVQPGPHLRRQRVELRVPVGKPKDYGAAPVHGRAVTLQGVGPVVKAGDGRQAQHVDRPRQDLLRGAIADDQATAAPAAYIDPQALQRHPVLPDALVRVADDEHVVGAVRDRRAQ